MPADIRSFFGGNVPTPIREKEKKAEEPKGKRSKARKVVEDSDDDEPAPVVEQPTPKKSTKKATKPDSPKGQETTTDDYFASSKKAKPVQPPPKAESNGRSSVKKATTSYNKYENDDDIAFLDDDKDTGDDIFAADVKRGGKQDEDAYVESESDEEIMPRGKAATSKAKSMPRHKNKDVDMKDLEDDDIAAPGKQPKKAKTSAGSRKRKSVGLDSDEEDDAVSVKAGKQKSTAKTSPAKKPAAKKAKKDEEPENAAMKAIFDNIPTVRAPTPPPKDPNAKFDWRNAAAGGGNAAAPPPMAGSKEIPVGEENCLAGLTFVFTGLLESISRDEGVELVKRYGGKVTGAPSSKTSYVVLGSDAGPSKLRKIKDMNIKTINEDGLFELIRRLPANGGDGKAAEKTMEKKRAELEKIKKDAEEMEKEEARKMMEAEKAHKEAQKLAAAKGVAAPATRKPAPSTSELWTTKYAPSQINQICGNKAQVEKIQAWLKGWPQAHKYNFQKRGAEGLGGYRAIIIHGPPGIGKTTAAHLAAKLADYDVIESNASDTRSKKLVETGLHEVLNNNSLYGYFAADGKEVDKNKKKIVLIMDEVDGMSAGDRGGVGALAKICKTTDIPMILICNERKLPKMKPFDFVTFDIPFRRPTVDQIRSRIATICHREGLKMPMPVIEALIEGSNKDIRQVINMISTAKLDQTAMDFDKGKSMSKAWEKHVILKPWDICHKLLGSGLFAPTSKATLNDKIELYFNDHEFSYLMLQENYLSTRPTLANKPGSTPREQRLRALELADQAAESISDGDLVDRMIHGSQQQWSLMPTHAVFSTVRPASFMAGQVTGTQFTQWLGNNSKYGKLTRFVKEIQSHLRLRTSGDRHEIRQQYLPVLWTRLIKRLEVEGKDAVEDVIGLMDHYFLTRDDFDYIMELGLGPQDQEKVHLETQAKSAFTRQYNSRSHPLPFMKASHVVAPKKMAKEKPDLEEAIDEDDDDDDAEVLDAAEVEDEESSEEIDLKKDKYIKQPKAKKPAAKKRAAKDDDDEEEAEKPKKARGRPKSKAAKK
ncbi:replication factor RFC1 C terminal domain-containing protein [Xylogone sp. PMI_703]|nr:replication factor RFC1 C terminal domain-containing protein [Xylogone sp. PMI_703]